MASKYMNENCWGVGLPNGALEKKLKKLLEEYNKIKDTLNKIKNPNETLPPTIIEA